MAQEVDAATASMIKNLEEKTGKSLDQWVAVARSSGIEKHGELVKRLKADHGLTHGYANLVVLYSRGHGEDSGEDLVAAQYAGLKSGLRPIYEAIVGRPHRERRRVSKPRTAGFSPFRSRTA